MKLSVHAVYDYLQRNIMNLNGRNNKVSLVFFYLLKFDRKENALCFILVLQINSGAGRDIKEVSGV